MPISGGITEDFANAERLDFADAVVKHLRALYPVDEYQRGFKDGQTNALAAIGSITEVFHK